MRPRQDAAADLDDGATRRLWLAVLRRALQDARGGDLASRHEARDWLANGGALSLLTNLGIDQPRAEELVAHELEEIERTEGACNGQNAGAID